MKGKKATKEAFTELAPRYEETVDGELKTFWGWSYRGFVDHLIEQTPIEPGDLILDIATGTAVIPRELVKKKSLGNTIIGLDITEFMLKEGQRNIGALTTNHSISLTCADAMALPFATGSYDVVISGLATHHMDIYKMISESYRVLKQGGIFSMIDVGISPFWQNPIMQSISQLLAFFYFLIKENLNRARAESSAITNIWTDNDWEEALNNAGFQNKVIERIPSTRKWIPDPIAIRAVK